MCGLVYNGQEGKVWYNRRSLDGYCFGGTIYGWCSLLLLYGVHGGSHRHMAKQT